MRATQVVALLATSWLLGACSVPAKQPATTGSGSDAGTDAPPSQSGVPNTTITRAPAEFTNLTAATFEFTSDVAGSHFLCSIDSETEVPCNSPYTRTLADGSHSFSVRAVGPDGAEDTTPAEALWTVDTMPPETMLTSTPPAADNSVTVQFTFTSNEMNVTFECSLDNASYVACTSGDTFGPLRDGTHSFAVRARDRAGNTDASPAIYAWAVNTATPDTQILSGPMGTSGDRNATFTFDSPDAGAGATFGCALDTPVFTPCTSPASYTGLAEGSHTFQVQVRDAVGNVDPTPATRTWLVDLTPPDTTITAGPTGTVRTASAMFTFTASENDVTYTCSLDGSPMQPCTSPYNAMMLAQGPHTFAVAATDAAGHTDPTPATATWTVDTTPPMIAITSGPGEGTTSGPRVIFTFTTTEGATTCSIDGAPAAPCTSPVGFNAPAGAHTFTVSAADAAGNVGTVTRSWTVACAAPTPDGAAGLLHLDDASQVQPNAVAGGASALLGDTDQPEITDPSAALGRFAGALAFNPVEGDHVSWPAMLGPAGMLTIEVWSRPDAAAGARDVVTTGDGALALRVAAVSPTTVVYAVSLRTNPAQAQVVTSAAVPAGAWHWVLVTFDGGTLRLWVDGVVRQTAANPQAPPAFDTLRLGGNYSGALDEVWIAQTAITDDEAALQRYCPAP